jgi:hypothetical protein
VRSQLLATLGLYVALFIAGRIVTARTAPRPTTG